MQYTTKEAGDTTNYSKSHSFGGSFAAFNSSLADKFKQIVPHVRLLQ